MILRSMNTAEACFVFLNILLKYISHLEASPFPVTNKNFGHLLGAPRFGAWRDLCPDTCYDKLGPSYFIQVLSIK